MAARAAPGTIQLLLEGHDFQNDPPVLQVMKKHHPVANGMFFTLFDSERTIEAILVSDAAPAETNDLIQLLQWDFTRCQDATVLHIQRWARLTQDACQGLDELRRAPTPARQQPQLGFAAGDQGQMAPNPYSRAFEQETFHVSSQQEPARGDAVDLAAQRQPSMAARDDAQPDHHAGHAGAPPPVPGWQGHAGHPNQFAQQQFSPQRFQRQAMGQSPYGHGQNPAAHAGSPTRQLLQQNFPGSPARGVPDPGIQDEDTLPGIPHQESFHAAPQAHGQMQSPGGAGSLQQSFQPFAQSGQPMLQQNLQQNFQQNCYQSGGAQPRQHTSSHPYARPLPGQQAPQPSFQQPEQLSAYQNMPQGLPVASSLPSASGVPGALRGNTQGLFTINGLSAYKGTNWRLLARVTKKSDVRKFQKKPPGSGEGQLFNADLIDKEGTETRAAFFGQAVDKFFDVLQDGRTFVFSGGRIKKGDMRYCQFDLEITFDERASILPEDDTGEVPRIVVSPIESLDCLTRQEDNATVDVAAVISEADAPSDFTRKKDNSQGKRQDVVLLDDSNTSCCLTLWGQSCGPQWEVGSVVLIKGVAVSSFFGKSLSSKPTSLYFFGTEACECHARAERLSRWYREQGAGAAASARPLSERRSATPVQTIAEARAESLSLEAPGAETVEGGDASRPVQKFHMLSPATVTYIPHDKPPFYLACPEEVPDEKKEGQKRQCNRKMEPGESCWRCSAGHQSQAPAVRWICQFSVSDHTGSQYVSSFDEAGQMLMDCKAEEAARRWESRESDGQAQTELERIFRAGLYKRWKIKCKSKKEFWNDEEKLKVTAMELLPINFVQDGRVKLAEVWQTLAAM